MFNGNMICLRCRGDLVGSGQEPHRHICSLCGQNYLAVFQLVPVEPLRQLGLTDGTERNKRTEK
jgi:hypothetical protein